MKLHKVKGICVDEGNKYVQFPGWHEEGSLPTNCPNSPEHTLKDGSLVIIETKDLSVPMMETRQSFKFGATATNNNQGVVIPIVSGQEKSVFKFSKDYYVELSGGRLDDIGEDEDLLGVFITPKGDIPVGTLSQAQNSGTSVLGVSQSVIDTGIKPGCFISFTQDDYDNHLEIIDVDPSGPSITISDPLSENKNQGSPLYVRFPIVTDRKLMVSDKGYELNTKDQISKPLKPTQQLVIYYFHKTTPSEDSSLRGELFLKY